MSLGVVERRINGVVVLDVMGRMLIEEGRAVCDYVLTHLGHHDRTLLVNLHNVAYIDSTGIADLIACHRLITDQGGRLYLTHLQPHIHELLDQSGLLRIFTTFADERAAIASLRRRPPSRRRRVTTDSLWTVDDLAKRPKVSERTVYRMLKTGRLRGAKVGRTWRFRDQDVLDMFQRASVVARASLLQRSPVVSKMPRCPFRSCATMRHPATSTVTVRLFEADAKAVGISGPQPLFRCLRCESVWREPITNIIEPVGTLRGQDFTPFTFVGSAELWRGTIYSAD